jgi:threonine/homoserine/homoserine lactone efflux protein
VVAGIGVALPLGAVGVLLMQEAVAGGWRPAAGGAVGIALVDALYAAVAVVAGVAVTAVLAGHERAVRLTGAALLVAVAARGLLALRTSPATARLPAARPTSPAAGVSRAMARFFGLTLVNPLTAVYFVALAAGARDLVSGSARSSVFVVGVLTSSLLWQLVLVALGAFAGSRMGERSRAVTALGGNLIVLGYAVHLAS